MEQYLEKLKLVHKSWQGLAALWLVAFSSVCVSVMSTPEGTYDANLGYTTYSHTAETMATICVIAYLVGGFILGKMHNKYTSNFVNANYETSKSGDTTTFKITPAKRHMGFWLIGLFGLFFMFSLAYMFAGSGGGLFFTLLLAGVFYLIGMQPKMWRQLNEQSFDISSSQLTANGETFSDIKGYFVSNFLPTREEKGMDPVQYYQQQHQQTYVYGTPGQVMAAQGMAAAQQIGVASTQAGGAAIAEVANRYFYEMRARSYQIEAIRGGKNVTVCKGLDANTAAAMIRDIEQITAKSMPMAAE